MPNGRFIISLDFELMWGVRDKLTVEQYGENILGVRKVIPELLGIFNKYAIKATFSTVGFLFYDKKNELLTDLPEIKPGYLHRNLSPYNGYMELVGENESVDHYHFARSLIKEIQKYPEQEIGTHTFSHYYCLERGQTKEEFEADIKASISIAEKLNIKLTSLVFPRNQFNKDHLEVCSNLGIICYRGNESSWIYAAKSGENESLLRRSVRLLDAYINLSGHNCYSVENLKKTFPINIPSSRFLRPYTPGTRFFDRIRLRRIKNAMTYAAKNNLMYHLWWHPHNFGKNIEMNFSFLEKILLHYRYLNKQFGFESITMSALAQKLINE